MNLLERPIYDLLQSEPFFANFLLGSKLKLDAPGVPTAGVCIQKGQITFVLNSEFIGKLTRQEQAAVLKHEVFHVLLDHCGARGAGINRTAKNYAMDCAINQHIQNLPVPSIGLTQLQELTGKHLAANECWEYYYEAIKDTAEKQKGPGEPNHEYMEGGEEGEAGEPSELEMALNKASVRDAANKAMTAAAGKVPSGLESVLASLNKTAQLPWKQILRNFVAKARDFRTKPTRLKPHRRFELDQPGKKKLKKLVLGVCTDSSGSVSDESYAAFMQEIATIAKSTTITYLVHADCVVQKVDVIKGGKAKPEVLSKRHGNGGTAYSPAIEHCKKLGCDAIIYFGDFDCADKPTNPGVPFLWVGVGNQPAPADFGRVLRLT
jgi:predicted metal-dependent peptidase